MEYYRKLLMPKINREGIWFSYYGDHVLWRWWWKRENQGVYWSEMHQVNFQFKRNYWKHVGALEENTRKHRVRSFDELTVLEGWAKYSFPNDYVVILKDINVSAKEASFWLKLPQHYRPHFLGDYVVLTCENSMEVHRLCDKIDYDFALAYGFAYGELIDNNEPENPRHEVEPWDENDLPTTQLIQGPSENNLRTG